MKIKFGTYTGDGTSSHPITGVGFRPDIAIVKAYLTTNDTWFRTKDMPATYSLPIRADSAHAIDCVVSLDSDGFTLAASTNGNQNGTVYAYACFADDGNGDFSTVTYTGNNTDDLSVFTTFQPTYALIKSDSAIVGAEKYAAQASALATETSNISAMNYQGGAERQDLIYFGGGGMRVNNGDTSGGNLVNVNATAHYGFVLKDRSGYIQTFTYTGNGTNNYSPVTLGFQPGMVHINCQSASFPSTAYAAVSTAQGWPWDGTEVSGLFNSFTSIGFQLGNNVGTASTNVNGNVYYGLAIVDPTISNSVNFVKAPTVMVMR